MNIQEWISKNIQLLSNVDEPRHELEILLSFVSKRSRSFILSDNYIKLSKSKLKMLNNLIYRRSQGEPIAYLLNEKEFWSLSLRVSYDTLIPRPDTEILVEIALSKIQKHNSLILDLGSGCGAIALSIASTCTHCKVIGIDRSKKAIQISKFNAFKLNIKNVYFFYSNWFSQIKRKFDMIVSNPPYVSFREIKKLKKDIFFEPINALISKKNGFADIKHIIKYAKNYLNPLGWLLIEHGWRQKKKLGIFFININLKIFNLIKIIVVMIVLL